MSSRHLLVLTALTTLFIARASAAQAPSAESLADLLLHDKVEQVETRLATAPETAENTAFRGEVEYRKGHFEQAEKLYRAALQMAETTARAHFGLGKLALARMRLTEAVQFFSRAVELEPQEPLYHFYISDALMAGRDVTESKRHLQEYLKLNPPDPDRIAMARATLDTYGAFTGVEIGEVDSPLRPSPIRVEKVLSLLFTEVYINGTGPYRFLVDTGATQTVLSNRLAKTLGLKQITSNIMHGVGGDGKLESPIYRADSLKIGDVTVRNLPLGTLGNPLLDQLMDGIVGTTLFSDFVVTINYPQSQIELTHEAPATGTAIPAWSFSGLLLVPVQVNNTFSGNFLIDTGADNTLLAHAMANDLGINKDTPGALLNLPIGGIGGLDDGVLLVPSVTLQTPFERKRFETLMSIELTGMSSLIQTELSGVIGYDMLRNYRVTLDYQRAEIRLGN